MDSQTNWYFLLSFLHCSHRDVIDQ